MATTLTPVHASLAGQVPPARRRSVRSVLRLVALGTVLVGCWLVLAAAGSTQLMLPGHASQRAHSVPWSSPACLQSRTRHQPMYPQLSHPLPGDQAGTSSTPAVPSTPAPSERPPSPSAPAVPTSTCIDLPEQSALVVRRVTDTTLRRALLELTNTPTGTRFLDYLLYMLSTVGSGFLSWDYHSGWRDPGAWSTPGGMIVLNWDSSSTDATNGSMIIHEATESYFDSLGIRQMGTQHADYVAQWFAGQFLAEEHARGAYLGGFGYGSYGKSFAQWLASDDSADFRHELPHVFPDAGNRWLAGYAWQEGHPMVDVRNAPDSMGLAPQMLTAAVVDPTAAAL